MSRWYFSKWSELTAILLSDKDDLYYPFSLSTWELPVDDLTVILTRISSVSKMAIRLLQLNWRTTPNPKRIGRKCRIENQKIFLYPTSSSNGMMKWEICSKQKGKECKSCINETSIALSFTSPEIRRSSALTSYDMPNEWKGDIQLVPSSPKMGSPSSKNTKYLPEWIL